MVKEYRLDRYVGDWAALMLAFFLVAVSLYVLLQAETYAKEAYLLTKECYEERSRVVQWEYEPVNQLDIWGSEVDINVSLNNDSTTT